MATDKQLAQLSSLGVFGIRKFLTASECERLRRRIRAANGSAAHIVRKGIVQVDEKFRRTLLVSLPQATVAGVGAKLAPLLPRLQEHFGVALTDYESPQFLAYRAGDYFRAHQDRGSSNLSKLVERRQVSVIVFLNGEDETPDSYGGGELFLYRLAGKLDWENCRTKVVGRTGMLIAFPSDVFHQVARVRWGERYTMVSWFY